MLYSSRSTIIHSLLSFLILDFYIWGRIKSIVYANDAPNTREEMLQRDEEAFGAVDGEEIRAQLKVEGSV